ncbi:High mobility group B protein 2 [Euphorbia peplus]|nr:High mobility group B protein 2 [Euphorbia peplus]
MKGGKFKANTKKHVNKTGTVKDPNKPKRPPTPFFVFMESFRRTYKKEYPEIRSVAAITRAAGRMWKSLSEAEKALFVAYAENMKVEYKKKMIAYNKEQDEEEDEFEKSESDEDNEDEDEDDDK